MIKKKEIVDAVAEATPLKKKDVREALEGILAYLHEQISSGEDVQIPPLGKIKIITQNEGTEKQKFVYRLVLAKEKTADAQEPVELD